MLNPSISRRLWLVAPAIAWSLLAAANPASAVEPKLAIEEKPSSIVQGLTEEEFGKQEQTLASATPEPSAPALPAATPITTLEPVTQAPSSLTTSSALQWPGQANPMAQMPAATQFSDVSPSDWAFEALTYLSSEYGCLAGYPDGLFRGNRTVSRYEFAAALSECLNSFGDQVLSAEALSRVEQLQQEFQTELATLASRIDLLEARTSELEANQFSTTTVLRGLAVFNVTGALVDDSVRAERNPFVPDIPFAAPIRDADNNPSVVEREQPNIVMDYLLYLSLISSFTGTDQLVTQLAVGNGSSPANELVSSGYFNTWGAPFLSTTPAPGGAQDSIIIREFFYSFSPLDDVRVTVGPRVNFYRHFDANPATFFIRGATSFNSNGSTLSNAVDRGAGVVVAWTISPQWELTVGYLAQNSEFLSFRSASDPAEGLFGGTNTLSGQIVYSPTDDFNLRFLYTHAQLQTTPDGYLTGEPIPYGFVDDGFGGAVEDASSDSFIVNFDWTITDGFGIFGRYSYGTTDVDPINPLLAGGDLNVQSFQAGVFFPDLGREGAFGVLSFLVPHDYLDGERFLLAGGGDGATQYEFEASYYFPLTENIAIVPAVYAIVNPNSFDSNPTVFVGNLRTQFSF